MPVTRDSEALGNLPIVGTPSVRRNLYESRSFSIDASDISFDEQTVRDTTVDLSSRALIEGNFTEGESSEENTRSNSPEPSEFTPLVQVQPPPAPPQQSAIQEIWAELTPANVAKNIPSVLLGTLLNVLDGLSYGMILFPLGTIPFQGLEAAGLSLFYVSTLVSQLVFSLGASHLKSCVGSEMIEIVPFFHSMAMTIAASLDGSPRDEILATTITCFALSSVVTGLVFFLLGYLKLGTIVGFFPRHILVGCIGGVGFFLIVTAIEVSSRMEGNLEYTLPMLRFLMEADVFYRWFSCLALAIVLVMLERRIHHPLLVPIVLGLACVVVYAIILSISQFSLQKARDNGWIFPAQEVGEPWYGFYSMYKFNKVHWLNLIETLPAMFALTFFGLIHVPINVPALAAATKNDDLNVNQELIAHGISNSLSGLLGSIQNYIVYTNSIMFIKSGGESRLSGVLLACGTCVVMLAGPASIGFIPVIVVASLMFMMGIDLMAEALVDTWGKVDRLEYITILAIVLTMGGYDFVVGILVGIVFACLSFVLSTSNNSCIRATFTGVTARSTVSRSVPLQKFLSRVGSQIYIIKLQGPLFFGTNVQFENECRKVIEESNDKIRYLIIDLHWVTHIDFCSADTFQKIKRLSDAHQIQMILSGAVQTHKVVRGLRAVDLIQDDDGPASAKLFASLNSSLEYCENQFLAQYYRQKERVDVQSSQMISAPRSAKARLSSGVGSSPFGTTPRASNLRQAAISQVDEDLQVRAKWAKLKQPLPLLLQVGEGTSIDMDQNAWYKLSKYFEKRSFFRGDEIVDANNNNICLVEQGILRNEILGFPGLYETMLAGTAFGNIRGGSEKFKVIAETDATLWLLRPEKFDQVLVDDVHLATKFLQVVMKLQAIRNNNLVSYLYVCAV